MKGDAMPPRPIAALRRALDDLVRRTDPDARLAADPLGWVRRYDRPADRAVASWFAAGLAYGRVAGFARVLDAVFARADARGGPAAWVDGFGARDADDLAPLVHRWTRGADLALLARTLQRARLAHGDVAAVVAAAPDRTALGPLLDHVVGCLRTHAQAVAGGAAWSDLPRGFRTLLPRPADGSACKRLCMLARWMVRRPGPGAAGVDLGLWDVDPAILIIPLDTHVHRLAWFIGLTDRQTASWRTAVDVTEGLRRLDPADPVRYDFALAHLGISGACRARFEPAVCGACALQPICRMGRATGADRGSGRTGRAG